MRLSRIGRLRKTTLPCPKTNKAASQSASLLLAETCCCSRGKLRAFSISFGLPHAFFTTERYTLLLHSNIFASLPLRSTTSSKLRTVVRRIVGLSRIFCYQLLPASLLQS